MYKKCNLYLQLYIQHHLPVLQLNMGMFQVYASVLPDQLLDTALPQVPVGQALEPVSRALRHPTDLPSGQCGQHTGNTVFLYFPSLLFLNPACWSVSHLNLSLASSRFFSFIHLPAVLVLQQLHLREGLHFLINLLQMVVLHGLLDLLLVDVLPGHVREPTLAQRGSPLTKLVPSFSDISRQVVQWQIVDQSPIVFLSTPIHDHTQYQVS